MTLPSHEEISIAVAEVFDCVRRKCPANLLNALVVVDTTMDLNHSNINYVVDYEMREICDFANAFKKQLDETTDRRQQARIKILIYCHIMEADLPLTVFWNLLRILDGAPPDWTFRRTTKAGKDEICEYPRQKIAELKRLSKQLNVKIGSVLDHLWQYDLRNRFSHSQYFWDSCDILTTTGALSPLSREKLFPLSRKDPKEEEPTKKGNPSFSLAQIERLYQGAISLLHYFICCYKITIAPFQDGKPHLLHTGAVVWNPQAEQWVYVYPNPQPGLCQKS